MPKDEVDAEDPLELRGVEISCADEREMVLAVVDEYVRLGFGPGELLALFESPRYTMTHRIWLRNGEAYVRDCIDDVLARWIPGGR